jgi:hypothetical protein
MSHWSTSFFILHSLEYQQAEKSAQLYAARRLDALGDRNVTPISRAEPSTAFAPGHRGAPDSPAYRDASRSAA